MTQQTYPVACECGVVHQCPAGYAGSRFACKCGKRVEVPVLSELRAGAGQAVLSPDAEIPALMAAKALPEEEDCCLCGCRTPDTLMLLATCEMPEAPSAVGQIAKSGCLLAPVLGFWGILIAAVRLQQISKAEATGRQVQLRFPLRMCQACAAEVSSWDVVRRAMRRTPVYARLLDKYPECALATVKGL
jgi:hypothetical protein